MAADKNRIKTTKPKTQPHEDCKGEGGWAGAEIPGRDYCGSNARRYCLSLFRRFLVCAAFHRFVCNGFCIRFWFGLRIESCSPVVWRFCAERIYYSLSFTVICHDLAWARPAVLAELYFLEKLLRPNLKLNPIEGFARIFG